jgi:nicotinamidase-related amidase
MTDDSRPRSPELMNANDTGLLVVDAQEKLIELVPGRERILWNIRRLLDAADALQIAKAGTEQYPEKLSPLVPEIKQRLGHVPDKRSFSAGVCASIFDAWRKQGIYRVLVCGIETHVCIEQTVFDLLSDGFLVYVAVDAVGARHPIDHETALRRMEHAGAVLTTTEAAIFEWCRDASHPEFKKISALSKESPP